ncbi:hypothetical protein JYU34_005289 [Plutella xylostella]|uniref:UDP-glucuronosyltransferase n=1 Tax=Plutella xylostella TaxID=51655 RepID=A0ABQ7QWD2_PLUXY|nr:hypothetical protein JYU34_005289 [Plutella xylostella]
MWKLLCVLAVCASQMVSGYRILVVFPFPNKSHSILGHGVVRVLLDAGHQVTYITNSPMKSSSPNLRQVDVSDNVNHFPINAFNLETFLQNQIRTDDITFFYEAFFVLNKATIANPNVQALMGDPAQEFDLVFVEWMFSELMSGLSAVYNCPYVWFSSMEPHWMILELIDEALNPAYTTEIMSLNSAPLTFTERVSELYGQLHTKAYKAIHYDSLERQAYEKGFGPFVAAKGRVLPPWEDVKYNASLMLANAHVSMGEATRLPQSFKPIGGYHIDPKTAPLPQDLQNIMDNASNGVIYFSMGSTLQSKDLPDEIKTSLLKMFGQLKQTVLWKFEENVPNLPKNVKIIKWAPQPSILAHPNCILFITHGGLLSTTETIHYGVPTIGIPAFADQFLNVKRSVKKGIAKMVYLSYNLADELKEAIEEMISNSSYRQRVQELSEVYHDRPAPPAAELAHWVRHVIRTRGAPHLRSPALLVPWYQKLYLDLAAVVFVVIVLLFVVVKRCLLCLVSSKKVKKS